jgi:glycerol-3-phosphate dehydrogenase
VDKMLDECIQMVPMIEDMRVQRSFASIRPLYQPPTEGEEEEHTTGIEVSRAFYVLDHEALDGVGGLITITGGKLTTSRMMAEKTVDLLCAKVGVDAPCRTHLEPLPTAS